MKYQKRILSFALALCLVGSCIVPTNCLHTFAENIDVSQSITSDSSNAPSDNVSMLPTIEETSTTELNSTTDLTSETTTTNTETTETTTEATTTQATTETKTEATTTEVTTVESATTEKPAYIIDAKCTKDSSKSIDISWSNALDSTVQTYYILRRNTVNNIGTGDWSTLASIDVATIADEEEHCYIDELHSSAIQQYEYKICSLSQDGLTNTSDATYADITNTYATLGSNLKICIDPGHFQSINNNYYTRGVEKKYKYSEAKFVLKVGLALRNELRKKYGIDSYMTRTTANISINGYKNNRLDSGRISLRGTIAKTKDCDFFISLHTNANGMNANGRRTWNQKTSINKVLVFSNQLAYQSATSVKIANQMGQNVLKVNQNVGIISKSKKFMPIKKNAPNAPWSTASIGSKSGGTVVFRRGSHGDYYGVLRGAALVKVNGILVEHAFHTTPVFRKKATQSLANKYAVAEAKAIASGYDFMTN